jgi:hypothetical protein
MRNLRYISNIAILATGLILSSCNNNPSKSVVEKIPKSNDISHEDLEIKIKSIDRPLRPAEYSLLKKRFHDDYFTELYWEEGSLTRDYPIEINNIKENYLAVLLKYHPEDNDEIKRIRLLLANGHEYNAKFGQGRGNPELARTEYEKMSEYYKKARE